MVHSGKQVDKSYRIKRCDNKMFKTPVLSYTAATSQRRALDTWEFISLKLIFLDNSGAMKMLHTWGECLTNRTEQSWGGGWGRGVRYLYIPQGVLVPSTRPSQRPLPAHPSHCASSPEPGGAACPARREESPRVHARDPGGPRPVLGFPRSTP